MIAIVCLFSLFAGMLIYGVYSIGLDINNNLKSIRQSLNYIAIMMADDHRSPYFPGPQGRQGWQGISGYQNKEGDQRDSGPQGANFDKKEPQ